jgi:hypothetical protein
MNVPRRIARLIFVAALLTWGRIALRSSHSPETWSQTQQRTAAFVVMIGAGMLALPVPKPGAKGSRRRERF